MRHIPEKDIRELGDIRFEPALERALQPCEDYDVNRWLFVPNAYTEYRYILGTRGRSPLICVGINPSTARPDALDPTLKSVERIAGANGFDSFLMFNVYAQRSTDPDSMEREMNPELHRENMKAFAYLLTLSRHVWAAWGTVVERRPYLMDCVRDMVRLGEDVTWYACGKRTSKGHPHHPLYLKSTEKLVPMDMHAYLEGFPGT